MGGSLLRDAEAEGVRDGAVEVVKVGRAGAAGALKLARIDGADGAADEDIGSMGC